MPIIGATPGIASVEYAVPDDVELPPGAPRTRVAYGLGEGVDAESLRFGNLRYADEAIASYARFRALKEDGVIPDHVRFQVSLPTALAVMAWIVPADRAAIEPAYLAALLREVARIVEAIRTTSSPSSSTFASRSSWLRATRWSSRGSTTCGGHPGTRAVARRRDS